MKIILNRNHCPDPWLVSPAPPEVDQNWPEMIGNLERSLPSSFFKEGIGTSALEGKPVRNPKAVRPKAVRPYPKKPSIFDSIQVPNLAEYLEYLNQLCFVRQIDNYILTVLVGSGLSGFMSRSPNSLSVMSHDLEIVKSTFFKVKTEPGSPSSLKVPSPPQNEIQNMAMGQN